MANRAAKIGIGAAFLAVFMYFGYAASGFAVFAVSPVRGPNEAGSIIEIPKGKSPRELTRLLVAGGILKPRDDTRFQTLGRITRLWKRVKVGEYKFTPAMTPFEIFRVLTSGVSVLHPLTVREGENMYEIASALQDLKLAQKETFLAACRNPKLTALLGPSNSAGERSSPSTPPANLEGYLFPDTYYLNKTMSAEDIARGMVRKFLSVWGAEQDGRAKALGLSRHQVITLASIVEKETGAPEERPMISSVFYNRLKKGMRLQSDPTTIYGIWNRYDGNLRKDDLLTQNAYNTYVISGLPVGPIANPGRESIHAALYPSTTDFLYFVSHNDGTHEFTKTYEAHLNAVRKFQLDPKAREGKSWRDLAKRNQQQQ